MKILGRSYTVKHVRHLAESSLLGQHIAATREILLEEGMTHDEEVSTAFHEILEAINNLLELDLEHKTITAIETGLTSVFLDTSIDMKPLLKDANGQS
jgi:hypothetical protein